MALVDWDALPVSPGMRPGSTRAAIAGAQLSAVRVVTEPDAVFDGRLHWHDNDQILIQIEGTSRHRIDDEEVTVGPGGLVFFPPGSMHGCIGIGDERSVYYELFAPARLDQLPGWLGPSVLRFDPPGPPAR